MSWTRTLNWASLFGAITFLLVCLFRLRFKDNGPEPFIDLEQELDNLQISQFSDVTEASLAVDLLNCSRLFVDHQYAQASGTERIGLVDPVDIDESCSAIRARWSFKASPSSAEEEHYPIAYDNVFLEQLLSVEYQPQNFYFYVLDTKADPIFRRRITNLAECFANVKVAEEEFDVQSNGKNVTRAFLAGLRLALHNPWNYVFFLQNHDVPLRTNFEKVRILKVFNGTNDVATTFVTSVIDPLLTWSVRELRLFKEANIIGVPDLYLRLTKSMVQAAISREASEYLTHNLSVDAFIDQLEQAEYGMDENMLSTLNSNEVVCLPGGFTTKCLENGKPVWSVTRKSFWKDGKASECRSRLLRHSICIVGVEDLAHLQALPNIYFNKMLPTVDYGAVACWLRRLNEREAAGIVTINETTYSELPHVRFNRWKQEHPTEPAPFCASGGHSSTDAVSAWMKVLILCVAIINSVIYYSIALLT